MSYGRHQPDGAVPVQRHVPQLLGSQPLEGDAGRGFEERAGRAFLDEHHRSVIREVQDHELDQQAGVITPMTAKIADTFSG
ncbi:hypothetical protein ACIGNX_31850 [Actinosynnema sp. NPDC053489]|uniref:hypothetical protein n=1 Tax=Actinosynnema sp. NPDC053489 TaxID=3363916 RepID=UPI0037CB747B